MQTHVVGPTFGGFIGWQRMVYTRCWVRKPAHGAALGVRRGSGTVLQTRVPLHAKAGGRLIVDRYRPDDSVGATGNVVCERGNALAERRVVRAAVGVEVDGRDVVDVA